MSSAWIRMRELSSTPNRPGRLPVSPASIHRWVSEGTFPRPVTLGRGVTAWPLHVVEAWERDKMQQAGIKTP